MLFWSILVLFIHDFIVYKLKKGGKGGWENQRAGPNERVKRERKKGKKKGKTNICLKKSW